MTMDKALTDSMDLAVATSLLGKQAVEIACFERAADVARETLDEALARNEVVEAELEAAKAGQRGTGVGLDGYQSLSNVECIGGIKNCTITKRDGKFFIVGNSTPPPYEGEVDFKNLYRDILNKIGDIVNGDSLTAYELLPDKIKSLVEKLATAESDRDVSKAKEEMRGMGFDYDDGVGYYCDMCNDKMRVQTPVTCFCDNKECKVSHRKNPPLLGSPPTEPARQGESYSAMMKKLGAEIERQDNRLAEAQAKWAAQDLYTKRIENEKADLRDRVKELEAKVGVRNVVNGDIQRAVDSQRFTITDLRNQLTKSEDRGNRNSKIIEAVCELVLDVVDEVPTSPQELVKRKLDALNCIITQLRNELEKKDARLAEAQAKWTAQDMHTKRIENEKVDLHTRLIRANAKLAEQTDRKNDCIAEANGLSRRLSAAREDTAMLIEAINAHYGIWVENECFTEGEVQELLEIATTAMGEPDKCPRCGKATKPNENGIYQCVDGQLCGEAVSAEPKSDCSPPQTFGDDDDEGIDGPLCVECGEQTQKPRSPGAGYADRWWCPRCNDFVACRRAD